jgi:hypothetical protein
MTATTSLDPGEPGSHGPETNLDALATGSLAACLQDQPLMGAQIQQTARAQTHAQLERQHEQEANWAATAARQRASTLSAQLDLAGRRFLSAGLGAAVVTGLLLLDVVPLNWAAQPFGLSSGGTGVITAILLTASAGAMAGLEAVRGETGRRLTLLGLMTAAFAVLTVLRASYLTTVAGEPTAAAVLQAVLLSAVSAALVVCGSVVLSRTRPPALSRALAAVRHAERWEVRCAAARRQAEEALQRHWAVLQRLLRDWSLTACTAPAGISQAEWAAALERSLVATFPAP